MYTVYGLKKGNRIVYIGYRKNSLLEYESYIDYTYRVLNKLYNDKYDEDLLYIKEEDVIIFKDNINYLAEVDELFNILCKSIIPKYNAVIGKNGDTLAFEFPLAEEDEEDYFNDVLFSKAIVG